MKHILFLIISYFLLEAMVIAEPVYFKGIFIDKENRRTSPSSILKKYADDSNLSDSQTKSLPRIAIAG